VVSELFYYLESQCSCIVLFFCVLIFYICGVQVAFNHKKGQFSWLLLLCVCVAIVHDTEYVLGMTWAQGMLSWAQGMLSLEQGMLLINRYEAQGRSLRAALLTNVKCMCHN